MPDEGRGFQEKCNVAKKLEQEDLPESLVTTRGQKKILFEVLRRDGGWCTLKPLPQIGSPCGCGGYYPFAGPGSPLFARGSQT